MLLKAGSAWLLPPFGNDSIGANSCPFNQLSAEVFEAGWLFPSWYASTVVENWTLHIQMIGFLADLTFELPLAVQSGDEDILNDGVHFPIEASALQFG